MSAFSSLMERFEWRPIKNCPGRYILAGGHSRLLPHEFASEGACSEYHVQAAPDIIVVLQIEGGGIISYKKSDGSYLHTLNTNDGFTRKLHQLGIKLPQ